MFALFDNPTIEQILQERESQLFDRKGARINWEALEDLLVGFTNADGGVIVVGVEKDKTITGIEDPSIIVSQIRKAATSSISPPISICIKALSCKNYKDEDSNLIIIEVKQGSEVHANRKDEVFLRIGDENVKLNHEQRMLLLDDRGRTSFELMDAKGAKIEDLSIDAIEEYKQALKAPSLSIEDLLLGRDLARKMDESLIINMAGIILFGKNPERWVERARIRFLRYDGTEERTGERLNVVKDVPIYGPLPNQIRLAQHALEGMLREFTQLDTSGRFITHPEYPEFAWKEAITNAIVHRSYSMRGADIQIKMFDDKLVIVSPGRFPGPVNEKNISDTHYSRNPRIARVVTELGFVRELGEGVNRIIDLMTRAALPAPEFLEKSSAEVQVILKNNIHLRSLSKTAQETDIPLDKEVLQSLSDLERRIILFVYQYEKITTKECESLTGRHRVTTVKDLGALVKKGMLEKVGELGPNIHYILGPKLVIKPKTSSVAAGQEKLFEKDLS